MIPLTRVKKEVTRVYILIIWILVGRWRGFRRAFLLVFVVLFSFFFKFFYLSVCSSWEILHYIG